MKTSAFFIRVTLCTLLSLVPASELENSLYSARMQARPNPFARPRVVLFALSSKIWKDPDAHRQIQEKLELQSGARVFDLPADRVSRESHWAMDSDGTVRRAVLSHRSGHSGEEESPSVAFSVYSELKLPMESLEAISDPHLINYLGPSGTIPKCSESLYESNQCGDLKNKIILLRRGDILTPNIFTPLGEMSPYEVIANDIETVVNLRVIHQVPFFACFLLIMGLVTVGALYIVYYPVMVSALSLSGTGIVVVIVLFQLVFQFWDIYFPSANILISLFITYLIFTGYRLAIQENLQWRSLKQAQYLRELDQMKTNFLTLVSHDLKTPLAKIQAVVDRMRREVQLPVEERSDWRDMIDSIENSNKEMRSFITSIINLSRLESQKVILNKKSNDINRLIQNVLLRLKSLAQQKGIEIEQSLDPIFSIECDEDLMRQVLTNLVDNAIKYSPPNSRVIVRSREEEGYVRVEVEDFGPGIPKDQLPLMFRKFSRILRASHEKEKVKGSGLGLYLSKYFIELHGGSIRVNSVEGNGTVFSFTLPLNGGDTDTKPMGI